MVNLTAKNGTCYISHKITSISYWLSGLPLVTGAFKKSSITLADSETPRIFQTTILTEPWLYSSSNTWTTPLCSSLLITTCSYLVSTLVINLLDHLKISTWDGTLSSQYLSLWLSSCKSSCLTSVYLCFQSRWVFWDAGIEVALWMQERPDRSHKTSTKTYTRDQNSSFNWDTLKFCLWPMFASLTQVVCQSFTQ